VDREKFEDCRMVLWEFFEQARSQGDIGLSLQVVDRLVQMTMVLGHANGTSRRLPPPRPAFQAWLRHQLGDKQEAIARDLATQLNRPVCQGRVSRWIKQVNHFFGMAKTGSLPHPSLLLLKPATIDLDRRRDGRAGRQRPTTNHDDQ
jgi:hypothetical protein